jgi:hypothetical protein
MRAARANARRAARNQGSKSPLLRTKDHLRSRCWETGRRGRLPNQRRGLPRWGLRHPLWPPQRGQGIRLSCPGPVARVPAAVLPVEGRRSACLAAGSTRRPRKRARARSGRHNTSPGWCPPARSQRTPLTGSAIRLRLPSVGRRTHPQPPGRDRARQRRPRASHRRLWDGTSCSSRGGGAQPTMGSFRVTDAAAPAATGLAARPLPTGSGAGWHVLDADVGEPGRNHNGVPVGAARVALGMIAVRPPGRPPHRGEAGRSRQCGRSR